MTTAAAHMKPLKLPDMSPEEFFTRRNAAKARRAANVAVRYAELEAQEIMEEAEQLVWDIEAGAIIEYGRTEGLALVAERKKHILEEAKKEAQRLIYEARRAAQLAREKVSRF